MRLAEDESYSPARCQEPCVVPANGRAVQKNLPRAAQPSSRRVVQGSAQELPHSDFLTQRSPMALFPERWVGGRKVWSARIRRLSSSRVVAFRFCTTGTVMIVMV
ncbi:Hypothetical protein Deide_1p00681 (plasmid) [Deinococcus deserti VCD115]|uniref:Uncharacterized protein n=1 Tax=Deinococcus deserti (strain DSM 17065 / CIP 109153 / LMG 22923 / VCD115) TaxID=546414 RepID=C1D232_DEIDV|nr:Hypothetical protein Deide_1p00681 [Deinococcus deserti VCD115]